MAESARLDELQRKYAENPRRYFAPLANEHRKAGELSTAVAICREQLARYPGHMSGHVVLGQALYESRRPIEAQAAFERALALDRSVAARLGARLRAHVMEHADYDTSMARMEALYRQLASAR